MFTLETDTVHTNRKQNNVGERVTLIMTTVHQTISGSW